MDFQPQVSAGPQFPVSAPPQPPTNIAVVPPEQNELRRTAVATLHSSQRMAAVTFVVTLILLYCLKPSFVTTQDDRNQTTVNINMVLLWSALAGALVYILSVYNLGGVFKQMKQKVSSLLK